jgi:hypothetical protein
MSSGGNMAHLVAPDHYARIVAIEKEDRSRGWSASKEPAIRIHIFRQMIGMVYPRVLTHQSSYDRLKYGSVDWDS